MMTVRLAVLLPLLLLSSLARAQFGYPPVNPTLFQVAGTTQTPQPARVNFGTGLTGSLSAGTLTITNSGVFSGVTADAPLTGSGTSGSHLTFSAQNANLVFAGPTSAGPTAPTFRALVAADIPNTIPTTSSVGPTMFSAGDSVCGGNTTTEFLDPWYSISTSGTTEVRVPLPAAMTARNFYAFSATAYSGSGTGVIYTILKNGSATAITCTQAIGATTCSDTAHTVSFAAGDDISIQKKGQTGITSGAQRCTASLQLTSN